MRQAAAVGLLAFGVLAANTARAQSAEPPLAAAGIAMSDLRPVEVDVVGTGVSEDAAVAKALANAIAQQSGTEVAQATVSGDVQAQGVLHAHERVATSATGNPPPKIKKTLGTVDQTTDQAANGNAQAAANAVVSSSGGRILRYSVLSNTVDAHGVYTATVHAVLQLYRRQSSATDLRKTLAVTAIEDPATPALGESLHEQLIIDLTQAGRFAVVDRVHDSDYENEMALTQSSDAAPDARAHAGQALGADFILTGKMHVIEARTTGHAAQRSSQTMALTGEVISQVSPSTLHRTKGAASAEFQLIEVATRRIVLADRATVTGDSVEALAQHITDELIDTIYPPRLISSDNPESLIISQGGSAMHPGQRFRMMQQGTEMFDPYTHESLGRVEHEAGMIEITDVRPRMSYAKLVDGAVPPGANIVLRSLPVPPPTPEPIVRRAIHHRTAGEPSDDAQGGVRLPGDH